MTRTQAAVMLSVFALGVLGATPAQAEGTGTKSGIVLSFEPYFDDATDTRERSVAGIEQVNEEVEIGRAPGFAFSLTYLAPVAKVVRIGGGFRYLSSYRHTFDEDDEADEEDRREENLGRLIEIYARGEWLISLGKSFQIVPAVELGLPLLFSRGELESELDSLDTQGFNVSSMPRTGLLLGLDLGPRYEALDWLALRGGAGFLYERLYLYNASTEDDLGQASRNLAIVRIRLFVAAEVTF